MLRGIVDEALILSMLHGIAFGPVGVKPGLPILRKGCVDQVHVVASLLHADVVVAFAERLAGGFSIEELTFVFAGVAPIGAFVQCLTGHLFSSLSKNAPAFLSGSVVKVPSGIRPPL